MKKRVLSMLLAFILCFSTLPMTAFAQEEQQAAVPAAEQEEAEAATAPGAETPADKSITAAAPGTEDSTAGEAPDTVKPTGESVSNNDAGTQDTAADDEKKAAVQKVQALIDALPDEVTAENADGLQAQLMAIDEALAALDDEQAAKLDRTRLENIHAALNGAVAVQDDGHDHETMGMEEWTSDNSLPTGGGSYYLNTDVTLEATWEPIGDTVLCLNGHSITMNADDTAVITVGSGVLFTLYDCQPSGRKGSITHGTDNNNTKYTGYGAIVQGGKFTMNDSVIQGNTAEKGGGVYVGGGTFEMNGSSCCIDDNTAEKGGGVYVERGTFKMNGGTLSNNTAAQNGGGVYMENYTAFKMTGGTLSNNKAAQNGGGVYVNPLSTDFTVAGKVKIDSNTDENNNSNNVYLKYNVRTPAIIGVGGELTDDARIGVTTESTPTANSTVTFAAAEVNYTLTAGDAACFVSDAGYTVSQKNNTIIFANSEPHEHAICGAETCSDNHTSVQWEPITSLDDIQGEGYYYLKNNVKVSSKWECNYNVKLCLNGKTITGTGGNDVIIVAANASLDITDCGGNDNGKGKITLPAGAIGRGIYVSGNAAFTLWNGDITGITPPATNKWGGSGVYVAYKGKFTMYGGAITENTSGGSGGGVYVAGGTFNMSGGEITGNTSTSHGGGVYVSSDSTFTMTGGKIIGNNTTTTNTDGYSGGGVYVDMYANRTGSFIVSGDAQITNNYWNGTLDDTYKYVNGTDSNVLLYGSGSTLATITIGENGLKPEARIGVSRNADSFDESNKAKIATGAKDTSLNYAAIFTSDDPQYVITNEQGILYLGVHQHNWNYTPSAEDKTTINAACTATGCSAADGKGGSVTIAAPDKLTYDGSPKAATVSASTDWMGEAVENIPITYENEDGNKSSTAPTNAGKYTASITLGDATAGVTYEIAKATPTAGDFTFTAPSGLTYNGEVKKATVVSNKEGMGTTVSVKYYQDEKVAEPVNAGEYTVKIDVTEGANYNAAEDLTIDSWKFTIGRSSITPTVKLSGDMTYTGNRITPDVTVTIDNKTLTADTDYTIEYGENITAGENAGSVTIKAATTGNYAFADVIENFDIEKAEQTLRFEESNVTKTFIDKPFSNLPIQVGNGTVTYKSDKETVATVNKTTGEVTIVGVGTATITATAAATTNYKERSASYTLTVNKALLVVNGAPVVQDKYYDGTADAVVTVSFADRNNALLNLNPTTDYTVTGTFSSANASTSRQKVGIKIELKGDYAKNYELKEDTYTAYAYINAKPISIVSATAVGREYKMGDTSVTISDVTFKDAIPGTLTEGEDYTVTGEMADADAGKDKVVNITVTLSGDAATNYNLSDTMPTTTVEISKATPVITAATWKTLMNNGIAVDISDWATFNNTDGAKLIYKLWDAIPEGVTLDENNLLKAENTVPDKSSFAIEVTAEATKNFEKPKTQYITVQVVNKITVGVEVKGGPDKVTYGDPDFSLTAGFDSKWADLAEGDNGTWSWSSDNANILEVEPSADGKTAKIHIKNAGTTYLTVTYSSDTYVGTAYLSITVNPKAITVDMIGNIDAQEYTGKDIKPTPEVKDGTTKLTNDTDFEYSYSNNTNAGTATLTITGKGNYEGEVTKEFTISPKSIDGASIELANKSFAYTGSEQTVNITSVKLSDGTILGTDDYVIKDNSNKATNAGEITLTIEGKGNYTGTATTTWAITKAVPKLADFDVVPDLSNELTYSGEEQIVNVTTKARGMGMITVRYNGSTEKPVNVGSYAITIDVADGSNYKAISGIEAGTLTIKKAAAPTLADVKVDHAYATTGAQTVSLADLVAGAIDYRLGEIEENETITGETVSENGVVTYTLTGKGAAGSTVTIPVTITSTNYEETTVNVVITIQQATPTGAPGYEFIHDSSKTLKDAGLDLINSTLNPKEGTLEWIDSNGKVLPGETKLEEGKKYIWRFTPGDPNYATITGELELYAPYRILDGADSTWTQSTDGTISIRGNGDFEKFQSVKVDGVVVDAKNYTVAKGSTIITFKGDYLKTLSTGSHTFELVWTDGSAATNFTIAAKPDNGDNNNDSNDDSDNDITVNGNVSSGNNTVPAVIGAPKTGDASGIWLTLFAVSLAGLAAMLVRKKNNRE